MASHSYTQLHNNNRNALIDYDSHKNITEIITHYNFGEVLYYSEIEDDNPLLSLINSFELSECKIPILEKKLKNNKEKIELDNDLIIKYLLIVNGLDDAQ